MLEVDQREDADAARETKPRSLVVVLLWGLAPAICLVLSGLCIKANGKEDIVSNAFYAFGLFGGLFLLLAWGLWLLNRTDLDWMEKWPLAVLIAFIAHCANIVIAIGACAFIDPPFSFPE
jgi:drug/metabolite transporter (DMT)-like permease